MKYSLEVYNDIFNRWDYVFSSNDLYVIETAFKEHKKKFKRKHYRIIEVLERS